MQTTQGSGGYCQSFGSTQRNRKALEGLNRGETLSDLKYRKINLAAVLGRNSQGGSRESSQGW